MLRPITIKTVRTLEGTPLGIELWQGDEHITISLELSGGVFSGYKWEEIKPAIDRAAAHQTEEVRKGAFEGFEWVDELMAAELAAQKKEQTRKKRGPTAVL